MMITHISIHCTHCDLEQERWEATILLDDRVYHADYGDKQIRIIDRITNKETVRPLDFPGLTGQVLVDMLQVALNA